MNKAALSEQDFIAIIKDDEPMSRYVEYILKEAYKYIKPHLRGEFPREAIEKRVYEFLNEYRKNMDWPEADEIVGRLMQPLALAICGHFERLWNGGELSDKIGQLVCPTCGGSGEVCKYDGKPYNPDSSVCMPKPCPDCTEKDSIYQRKIGDEHYPSPNERKGQQRVRSTEAVIIIGKASRGKDNYIARNTDGEIRFVCIGQREKDRRSETLTGSLKDMRVQE